jgi:hypothetical protein
VCKTREIEVVIGGSISGFGRGSTQGKEPKREIGDVERSHFTVIDSIDQGAIQGSLI